MFNLASDWELFRDLNHVRKVKFFRELNTGMRVLSPQEEESLLRNAAPYIQDLIGHSAITVTMRYTHTNLDSKHPAVAKLEAFGDTSVIVCTKARQAKEGLSPSAVLSYNVART